MVDETILGLQHPPFEVTTKHILERSVSSYVDVAEGGVRADRTVAIIDAANVVISCWGWSGP